MAADRILGHSFVTGEVMLGGIASRRKVVARLEQLPRLRVASHDHVMMLVENHRLWSCGVGYVDLNLLASVPLSPDAMPWTRDKRLHAQADRPGVAAAPA